MIGFLVNCSEGLLCPRGGTREAKQKLVNLIKKRQMSLENEGST